jgi:hypothetical protein
MPRKNRNVRPTSDGVPYSQAIYFIASEAIAVNDLICPSGAVTGYLPSMQKLDTAALGQGLVWVAKNAVPSGSRGIAIPWRLIKDLDTSAYGAGQILYADWSTPGTYAAWGAGPSGRFAFAVGQVLVSDATAGVILLDPANATTPPRGVAEAVPVATAAAPAIPLTEPVVLMDGGSNPTLTLGGGDNGQVLTLVQTTAGTITIANTTINNGTLTHNAVGEASTLVFDTTSGKWSIIGTTGAIT